MVLNSDKRVVVHHVGGHLHGLRKLFVSRDAHATLTRAQAPYVHLLRCTKLPTCVAVAIVLFDLAAVLKLVATEIERLGHLLLAPFTITQKGRNLLRHPSTTKEGEGDED